MKRDVGMAYQKVHNKREVKVNIQSLINPYIFSQESKDLRMDETLYIYYHFYILPCVLLACPTSLFIFNDFFSFLLLYFWGG